MSQLSRLFGRLARCARHPDDHIDMATGTLGVGGAAYDPYAEAERAAVAFYGSVEDDPQTGWITAASLRSGPHVSSPWVPPQIDIEIVDLPWLPRSAWKEDQ